MSRHSITILIEGHGLEYLDRLLDDELREHIELLTFCGLPGEDSLSNYCIEPGRSTELESVDLKVLSLLKDSYDSTQSDGEQGDIFESPEFHHDLRSKYREAHILYNEDYAFQITRPVNEKLFNFEDDEHDSCIDCIEINPLHGQCRKAQTRMHWKSPLKGIYIVSSSLESDEGFTLATLKNIEVSPLETNSNFHNPLPLVREHWLRKLGSTEEEVAVQDEEGLQLFQDCVDKKQITLSGLIKLFNKMGYNKIRILDSSCRSLAKTNTTDGKERYLTADEVEVLMVNGTIFKIAEKERQLFRGGKKKHKTRKTRKTRKLKVKRHKKNKNVSKKKMR